MKKIVILLLLGILLYLFYPKQKHLELVDLSQRASWLNTKQQLEKKAGKVLEMMIIDAQKDRMCLVVTSGYRTFREQTIVKQERGNLAANPGYSEHEKGIAVDFTACPMSGGIRNDDIERPELVKPFEELPEYQWLLKNAYKYRFYQSYTNESWHWKYKKSSFDIFNL